ncbi:MAG: YdeI/OmpD-associated family protein [Myxococcaceae bacterium]|nr:YdeI/OmpD-associated family protein [Myxococcaceae bacterium]
MKHQKDRAVDEVLKKERRWRAEFDALRAIALSCGLEESLKWGQACYSREGSNVVLIHGFQAYCALLFFKGALLTDAHGLLVQQTKNVQAARQLRFSSLAVVKARKPIVKATIEEAIAVDRSGQQVKLKKTHEYGVPEELQRRLDESAELDEAFHALTPGRQRGYLLHFSSARRAETREARIQKELPRILRGLGLDD